MGQETARIDKEGGIREKREQLSNNFKKILVRVNLQIKIHLGKTKKNKQLNNKLKKNQLEYLMGSKQMEKRIIG